MKSMIFMGIKYQGVSEMAVISERIVTVIMK